MKRLRVLMLATDLQRGGLPLRLVALARRIRDLDVEPIVGCLARPGPLSATLERDGITTFACNAAGRFDASCLIRLARHVREFNPDLIHSALMHANLAARLVGRLDRRRPIVTSTVTIEIERLWHRWVESFTASASDLHVANSEAVARHLREEVGCSFDRLRIIPNGVDLDLIDAAPPVCRGEFGIPEKCRLLVWAGRIDPIKNLEVFIDCVSRLQPRMPLRAVLIGEGPARARWERLSTTMGLERVVRFIGWSDNVPGWIKSADALMFPSRTEGAPNLVLEALACRCPVIASDIPACAELLDGGRAGILCPPHDGAVFAKALETLLTDRPHAERLAEAGRRLVETRHRLEDVARQWRGLYDEVTAGS